MLSDVIGSDPELAAGWSLESGAAGEVEVTATTVLWEIMEAQGMRGVQDMIDQARPSGASPGTVSGGAAVGTSAEHTGEEMTDWPVSRNEMNEKPPVHILVSGLLQSPTRECHVLGVFACSHATCILACHV
jgi:hypothetical protein